MTKPTLLVDQDGPLADFDAQFFSLCRDNGWAMDASLETQKHRFATDHILNDQERRAARTYVNQDPRWFHDLPVVEGAVDGLNELDKHFEVWLCTKPLEANKACRDGKADWVRRHLGEKWERRLIITPDKSLVHGVALLDDAPKPEWFARAPWRPIIFPTPWNRQGSKWAELPAWRWGDPVTDLIALTEEVFP